jgi:amino-acid N-acetyltransferase
MAQIRKARLSDAEAITDLINGYAEQGLMLHKSLVQVYEHLREFLVVEDDDGTLIGCGALRLMWHDLAEVRSLAIHERAKGRGLGRHLVARLIEEAHEMELVRVFALTYQDTFFGKLGFTVVAKHDFPQKVWADCRSCPKRHACDEIAMVLVLDPIRAAEAHAQTEEAYRLLGLPITAQITPAEAPQPLEPLAPAAATEEPPVSQPQFIPLESLLALEIAA